MKKIVILAGMAIVAISCTIENYVGGIDSPNTPIPLF